MENRQKCAAIAVGSRARSRRIQWRRRRVRTSSRCAAAKRARTRLLTRKRSFERFRSFDVFFPPFHRHTPSAECGGHTKGLAKATSLIGRMIGRMAGRLPTQWRMTLGSVQRAYLQRAGWE